MADLLHILRAHTLGLPQARQIASLWARQAEQKYGMACSYTEGAASDELGFARPGFEGSLSVTPAQFEFKAQLGFVFSAFKDRIESEISSNLDELLKRQELEKT